jgi:hypothetical protein
VATIVTGDDVTPLTTGQAVNHYSLLHTLESLNGLPALDQAATAPVMEFGRTAPPVKLPINPRLSDIMDPLRLRSPAAAAGPRPTGCTHIGLTPA